MGCCFGGGREGKHLPIRGIKEKKIDSGKKIIAVLNDEEKTNKQKTNYEKEIEKVIRE